MTLRANLERGWSWLRARSEILVAILGILVFFSLAEDMGVQLSTLQATLAWGAAAVYAGLILVRPMVLPTKDPGSLTRQRLKKAALIVIPTVLLLLLLQTLLYQGPSRSGGGWRTILFLLLLVVLGPTGIAAEGMLPVDLFPILRRREVRRIVYAAVSALFLTMLIQVWGGLFGDLAQSIGSALGEIPPPDQGAVSHFAGYSPLALFVTQLASAAFEELLFRAGILTLIWVLTGRWWAGLLVSSLCFGLYHISLSGMSDYFLQAPVIAVVDSFGAGLANGVLFRYRGLTATVLIHGLGNWLLLMFLMGSGG
ncbi:MAG: CPBP family intramembrane metalloprotease [Anaerolineae bacterium]|nr:CPBP family intramembrane metalloprotease [Anaerolineae bacterium]